MTYSPVELRHVSLQRRLFGYDRAAVDTMLDDVADSYEQVWRDRVNLGDRIEQLEGELTRHKELEHLLRADARSPPSRLPTPSRRRAAPTRTRSSRRLAHEARDITRRARAERESLMLDARRIRLLLNAALDAIDEVPADDLARGAAGGRGGGRLARTYTGHEMPDTGTRLKLRVVPGAGAARSSAGTERPGRFASAPHPSAAARTQSSWSCSRSGWACGRRSSRSSRATRLGTRWSSCVVCRRVEAASRMEG